MLLSNQLSIKQTFILMLLSSLLIGGVLISLIMYSVEEKNFRELHIENFKSLVESVAQNIENSFYQESDANKIRQLINSYKANKSFDKLRLIKNNKIYLSTKIEEEGKSTPIILNSKLKDFNAEPNKFKVIHTDKKIIFTKTINAPINGRSYKNKEPIILVASFDLSVVYQDLQTHLFIYLVAMSLVSLLISCWAYYFFTVYIKNPLNLLIDFSNTLANGAFGKKIALEQGKELLTLGKSLNKLSQKLYIDKKENLKLLDSLKDNQRDLELASCAFNTTEGILIADKTGRIIKFNKAFSKISGFVCSEIIGKYFNEFITEKDNENVYREVLECLHSFSFWKGDVLTRDKAGRVIYVSLTISKVYSESLKTVYYVGCFSDLTAHKEIEDKLSRFSSYDRLTGLPNRTLLMELISQSISVDDRINQTGCIICLGLDHFSDINDAIGRQAGDQLLCQVSNKLSRFLRKGDVLSRLEGDVFCLLVNGLGDDQRSAEIKIAEVTDRIRSTLSSEIYVEGEKAHISATMGVIFIPERKKHIDVNVEVLLQKAVTAMDIAKASGPNTVKFFSPDMLELLDKRFRVRHQLSDALILDQLELYLQPQINVSSGKLEGAECLIRWNHPVDGFIPPDVFIPIAEHSNLITLIDNWVLKKSCALLNTLDEQSVTLSRISVNISAKHFLRPNFVDEVLGVLKDNNCDPNRFCLEVTEGAFLDNISAAADRMRKLKAVGIEFSIDDFGTGYSSLSYLERLPVDELKIDKSFVDSIPNNPRGILIAKTVMTLAEQLGYRVVAEGVETEVQLSFLQKNHCAIYQGYYFSQPLPLQTFISKFKGGN